MLLEYVLLPLYLLGFTVWFTAVVHKPRTVALQRCINDLWRHNAISSISAGHFECCLNMSIAICHIITYLIVFKRHEIVVDVFISSIFFHSCFKLFVVQHLPTVFQDKSVPEIKSKQNYHLVIFGNNKVQHMQLYPVYFC